MAKDQRKGVPVLPAVPEDEIRQEVIADDNTRYVLHLRRQVLEQYVSLSPLRRHDELYESPNYECILCNGRKCRSVFDYLSANQ
ncbi:hypothetical protein M8J77_005418 [Diaphorina citri]|nr:hypothetical protein M8J77_005418 [Diaphorina citri]